MYAWVAIENVAMSIGTSELLPLCSTMIVCDRLRSRWAAETPTRRRRSLRTQPVRRTGRKSSLWAGSVHVRQPPNARSSLKA